MFTTCLPPVVSRIRSCGGAEFYFTASSDRIGSAADQAKRLYSAVRDMLVAEDAWIFNERLFASREVLAQVLDARVRVLGNRMDAVPPTCVLAASVAGRSTIGLQIHALRGPERPTPLACWGRPNAMAGRTFTREGKTWLFLSGRCVASGPSPGEQTRRTFHCTRCMLDQAGTTMRSVARTWLWLDHILDWYTQLNQERTRYFKEQHLLDEVRGVIRLPASTGIGLGGSDGGACTMDLIAMPGQEADIHPIEAGGHQNSAFRYGSAFSRACVAPMPGGPTAFISGTAAIDSAGHTQHVGRADRQIVATLRHVRALLTQLGCGDEHVLTALVYCKNVQVLETFERLCPKHPWPLIPLIADVCRDDLLFEVEVTASAGAHT